MLKKNSLSNLSVSKIFFLSLIICILFYFLEGILGINRLYHPDSIHYMQQNNENVRDFLDIIFSSPLSILSTGYYYISKLLNHNYFLLIGLNFIFYSLTNIFIYEKIIKTFCKNHSVSKSLVLFYLLFLDPYRLHLACHVLKETIYIFIFITLIIFNYKFLRLFLVVLLEFFRANSFFYLLIFIRYFYLKKKILFLFSKKNSYDIKYLITKILLLFFALLLFLAYGFGELIYSFFNEILLKVKELHFRDMPQRDYDKILNFQSFDFFLGFILKNILWPLGLLSGTFIFFTNSFLFKILGICIFLNHCLVYFLTKKTFVSLGLFSIILLISMYTSSYTSMFRYSYVGLYFGLVYFFLNVVHKNE